MITGAGGHIGAHLFDRLSDHNQVVGVDNNLLVQSEHSRKEILNISTREVVTEFKNEVFDYVFHFGEYSRVEQSFSDFNLVLESNNQLHWLLPWCEKMRAKFIYSGSSTKFYSVTNSSLSPYTFSKVQNCELIKSYAKWFELDYAIVYFSNVFGGRERKTGKYATLIGKYCQLVAQGEVTLPVTGDGHQRRNFTHIEDTINAIIMVAERGTGDGYCVANEKDLSINEVVRLFGGQPVYYPNVSGNRNSSGKLPTKLRELGWYPEKDLSEFIKNWMKENV